VNNNVSYASELREAAKKALETRHQFGYAPSDPCDVYDLIHRMRVQLQFVDIPTLEGMLLQETEAIRICISAQRPSGRQRFTAAHELGHFLLKHGTQIHDEQQLECKAPVGSLVEKAADTFARFLLMPPRAVHSALQRRKVDVVSCSSADVYNLAMWLGVGFDTLVHHLEYSMNIINGVRAKNLRKTKPKQIRNEICQIPDCGDVWVLDEMWSGRIIHAQLGDILIGIDKQPVRINCVGSHTYRLANSDSSVIVRSSKPNFVGFYEYRYLEEEE
jgi:hypothetical protein